MRVRVISWLICITSLATLNSLQAQSPPSINPYGALVGPSFGYTAQGQRAAYLTVTSNPASEYFPFAGGLAIPEDDGYVTLALPFNINFFNHIVPAGNPLFASANGYLTLGTSSISVTPTNIQNESVSFGNQPAIVPMFTDLIARGQKPGGPGLYVLTEGTVGDRRMTIEWSAMQHFNNEEVTQPISFQVRLFEDSSRLDFNYESTIFGTNADQGKAATVGIRDTTFSDPPDNVLQWGFLAGTSGGVGIELGGEQFQIQFMGTTAVPEPAGIILCSLAGAGMASSVWLRRRNKRKTPRTRR